MEDEHAEFAAQLGARRAVTFERQIRDPYGRGPDVYRDTWTELSRQIPDVLHEHVI